jgi:hypothetical protein
MATARPFAYNPGSPISGTEQLGDLAVGTPDGGFTNSPQFWNGPDEELGYVIALPVPDNTHPTPIPGVTASVRFIRSGDVSEQSFVDLVNTQFGQNVTSGNEAKTWLDGQGYWSSWSGFGSSGFQWMTINSITSTTASGIGQNSIGITITQSAGGMETHSGMYSAATFPETYGVPFDGVQILNQEAGVFTAVFSQPVTDPLVAFASVGNGSLYVPVQVSAPFTPIWGTSTTYQNAVNGTQYTQFTGNEGFNIIRIDGTVSTVSFTYTQSEYYCTVCFGFVDQNA